MIIRVSFIPTDRIIPLVWYQNAEIIQNCNIWVKSPHYPTSDSPIFNKMPSQQLQFSLSIHWKGGIFQFDFLLCRFWWCGTTYSVPCVNSTQFLFNDRNSNKWMFLKIKSSISAQISNSIDKQAQETFKMLLTIVASILGKALKKWQNNLRYQ